MCGWVLSSQCNNKYTEYTKEKNATTTIIKNDRRTLRRKQRPRRMAPTMSGVPPSSRSSRLLQSHWRWCGFQGGGTWTLAPNTRPRTNFPIPSQQNLHYTPMPLRSLAPQVAVVLGRNVKHRPAPRVLGHLVACIFACARGGEQSVTHARSFVMTSYPKGVVTTSCTASHPYLPNPSLLS